MLQETDLHDHYKKAKALLADGDLRQAADICKQMLEADPRFAYGYHLMAALFKTTGNYEKALNFSQMAIELEPSVLSFHMQRGQVLFALAQWEAAGAVFAMGHLLQPQEAMPLIWWADCCARQGRFEEAGILFTQA